MGEGEVEVEEKRGNGREGEGKRGGERGVHTNPPTHTQRRRRRRREINRKGSKEVVGEDTSNVDGRERPTDRKMHEGGKTINPNRDNPIKSRSS